MKELQVVGTAFLSGAVITFVYDLLRIFRRVISHGTLWIAIEDGLFWIWTSLWIFSVLYRENDGNLRMYTILTMVLGMIVYHKTFSEFFVRIMGNVFRKIVKSMLYPLKRIKVFGVFCGKKLKKFMEHIIMKENE